MFQIKKPNTSDDLCYLKPEMYIVLGHFLRFAKDHAVPVVITNMLTDAPGSVSRTHSQGRALDFSVIGWSQKTIDACECYIRTKCGHLGAISAKTGQPNVIYYHKVEGSAFHFHVQVSS